jgi:Helix-turn-helix domain
MWSAGQGDNQERFLADFRALREAAALGYDELAARAHYPSSILKEAENGPGLPGLPILAAYVRACEADVPEWEERWRRLAYEAETDPGLPVRPAGASPAAVAGARAGISVAPADVYDPERIRAALRGGTADPAVRDTAAPRVAAPARADPEPAPPATVTQEGPAPWKSGTSWSDSVWDAGSSRAAGSGWETKTRRDAPASWTAAADQDTAPANGIHHATYADSVFDPPVAEVFGHETPSSPVAVDDTEPATWSADIQIAPSVTAKTEPAWPPADTGHEIPQDVEPAPEPAQGTGSAGVGAEAVGSALPQAARVPVRAPMPDEPRSARFFPLRLIAVMVIAAIIGSVLVLVIR